MYDVILISPHYNYGRDGEMIPAGLDPDHEDLSMTIPLGLIHIAQYLHDCGFKVRVVHIPHEMQALRRVGIDPEDKKDPVRSLLRRYPARVCGIQAHWYLYCGGAVYVSRIYRDLFPDSRIFLGGHMASALWKEFLTATGDVDGIVLGEGEEIFRNIVDNDRPDDDDWQRLDGIAFKRPDGTLVYRPPVAVGALGIDALPIVHPGAPPFANLFWPRRHFIDISRGVCPEPCVYCVGNNRHLNARRFQTLRIDRILEQISVYGQWGIERIFFGENQFLDASFLTALVEAITGQDHPAVFEMETHPVMFENDVLLEKMIRAGFLRFTMGCESGADSLLRRIGRRSTVRQIKDGVERIVEKGAVVLTSWISNLPGETMSEFKKTQAVMRHVATAGGFVYWVENLHVLPGSRLHAHPGKWGVRVLLKDLADWIGWSMVSKQYVCFEDVYRAPLNYLTHLNMDLTPKRMIDRFYAGRTTALALVPRMETHLNERAARLPRELFATEMQRLDWYESKGWKLWLI